MKGLQKGFLGLMILSAMGLTVAPLSVGSALADNAAPAGTAPAATAPAKTAPAAKPAAKKAPVKKVAKKHVKVAKKKVFHGPTFAGVVKHMDMNASPMTLVVVKNSGKKSEFVFGGDLTSRTAIYKGKKKVGMSALKEGQKVVLHYRNTHGSVVITALWIH
jgi:hypothetical protein